MLLCQKKAANDILMTVCAGSSIYSIYLPGSYVKCFASCFLDGLRLNDISSLDVTADVLLPP